MFSCKKNNNEQPPIPNNQALAWAKTFGGTGYDFANSAVQLSGGDYVFAGASRSNDGDLSGSRVGYDYWLTRIGTDGAKQWSVTFGNNTYDEHATSVVATADGNVVLVGYAFSPATTNLAWAIKANGSGGKVWEKQISNSTDAKPLGAVSTSDGGVVIAGYESAGADRNGFVVKLDANGNEVWKKSFGGGGEDQLTGITKTSDGGFALSGFSNSSNGDLSTGKGSYDGWILKLDASGNKSWSSSFGGSSEDYLTTLTATNDGGVAAAGYTKSSNGDIPAIKGGNEAWIIKVDGSGNKSWVKTYGGVNEEYITSIVTNSAGNLLVLGHSNSTTGDVTRTDNDFGGWLLKLDASGNKSGSSTYGERADDFTANIIATQDGGYLISGNTDRAGTGRGYDAWILKLGNF